MAQAVAEVQAEAKAGTTLTPTPEMVLVSNKLEQLGGQLEQAIAAREPKVAGSPPDASTEPELAALIIQFQQLEQGLHQLDVRRRLDIGGQLAGISAPVAQSESRFGRLLISVGLINSMGQVSRVLTTASLVLLAPTLLTISGSVLADALDQANIAIHDLVVADFEAQAERDWQTSMPPPPQPRELTQDDTTVIHLLSLHYQHYARAHTAREFHVTAKSSAVRRRVLDDFAADHLTRLEVHGGPGEHPADPGAAMSTVGREPFGEEARRAQEILELHARNTSEREWAAFREKAEAFLHSFGQPLSTGDLGQRLFTEILNTGGSIAFDGGPESSALRSIIAEVGQPGSAAEEAGRLMKIDVLRFAMDVYARGSPDLAGHPLGGSVGLHSSETEHWADEVRHQVALAVNPSGQSVDVPPTLEMRLPPESELKPSTEAVRDAMLRARTPADAAEASNLITQYADIAPGVQAAEMHTPRGRLLSEFPEAVQSIAQGATDAVANFARARSYVALRGFAKIGGVLIGLGPESDNGPDVVGLDWKDTPKGLMLQIALADGPALAYGPFRAEIVRRALAYAADGRPITATMPLALPLGRRVLIHPALVNSALGCESRLLDQFVDGATSDADYRTKAEELVLDQTSLYELAWADQFLRLDSPDLDKSLPKLTKYLASLRAIAPKMLADAAHKDAADRAISYPQAGRTPLGRPLRPRRRISMNIWLAKLKRVLAKIMIGRRFAPASQGVRLRSSTFVRSTGYIIHLVLGPRAVSVRALTD